SNGMIFMRARIQAPGGARQSRRDPHELWSKRARLGTFAAASRSGEMAESQGGAKFIPWHEAAPLLVDVAMGRKPADLVVRNGRWVNVHSGEIIDGTDIAIAAGRFAY